MASHTTKLTVYLSADSVGWAVQWFAKVGQLRTIFTVPLTEAGRQAAELPAEQPHPDPDPAMPAQPPMYLRVCWSDGKTSHDGSNIEWHMVQLEHAQAEDLSVHLADTITGPAVTVPHPTEGNVFGRYHMSIKGFQSAI